MFCFYNRLDAGKIVVAVALEMGGYLGTPRRTT